MTSKTSRFPHTLVLIFGLIVLAQALTYALDPGQFTREPNPIKGKPFTEIAGGAPLRVRLAAAMKERQVDAKTLASRFQVSPLTVENWLRGPRPEKPQGAPGDPAGASVEYGSQIEATVGSLLDAWVRTGAPPTQAEIDAWKTAMPGKKKLLVPDTYAVDQEALAARGKQPWYQPVLAVFTAIPRGLTNPEAVEIIMFVFLIGGVLAVMRATGAFDALIGAAIRAFGTNANLLIGGTIALFAVGSGVIGMAEEYVPFIALLVTMSLALGLDAMVGIAIVLVGYAVGYGCAPYNPFTVVIAQGIANLEPNSGHLYRWGLMAVCLVVGIHHVVRYANRVRRDRSRSLVQDIDYTSGFELPENVPLNLPRILVLASFAATVVIFVYGVKNWDWYLMELSAIFLALGVVVALVGGVSPNRTAKEFCHGAGELTTTALLIGFARTIQIVMDDAQITDTVVMKIASTLEGAGPEVGAVSMLGVQTICNFFIPSGSGQAYVTMPIMAPLATQLGIEKQVAVLAYQIGDGFTNVITPTNAAMMGMLAMARVPYQRWLRFVFSLMVKLYIVAALGLIVAVWTGYS